MKRRDFIGLLGAAACAWPVLAVAQQTARVPRIGVLWHAANEEEEAVYLAALRQGLREFSYVEGRNIVLENRFPNEIPERFVSLAAELAALKVDVLVAVTRLAALAAKPISAVAGTPPKRVTIQVWDSMDALNKWYNGADYQAALKIGEKYATFRRYAVEGQ